MAETELVAKEEEEEEDKGETKEEIERNFAL
jgi:hypothetical protein